jgi:hypothetical protein
MVVYLNNRNSRLRTAVRDDSFIQGILALDGVSSSYVMTVKYMPKHETIKQKYGIRPGRFAEMMDSVSVWGSWARSGTARHLAKV